MQEGRLERQDGRARRGRARQLVGVGARDACPMCVEVAARTNRVSSSCGTADARSRIASAPAARDS